MMNVKNNKKIRLLLEFNDVKATFEGDVDEVLKAAIRFLSEIYPNIELVQKVTYTPDLVRLIECIKGIVELTPEGPVFTSDFQLSAREKICIALLGAYVGEKLGKLSKTSLSTQELTRITKKAKKTISNELPKLINRGLVKRTSEGECQLTVLGIREAENLIKDYRESGDLPTN